MSCTKERIDEQAENEIDEGICCETMAPAGLSLLVKRERLLLQLCMRGPKAGISIVCAPSGFGKTALLMQYVQAVSENPERGAARMIDVSALDEEHIYGLLKSLPDELEAAMRPLVALDGMPVLGEEALATIPALLRTLQAQGFEFVISCKPSNRAFVIAMGDSYKIAAQAMIVQPREYPDWTSTYRIDGSLDMYALSQGVPRLVAMMCMLDGSSSPEAQMARGAAALYREVVADLRKSRDALYRLVCMMLLMGAGSLGDFERSGMRLRAEQISRLRHDYPIFGLSAAGQNFRCMAQDTKEYNGLCREIVERRPRFAQRAMRVLLDAGRVDRVVALARLGVDERDIQALIEERPLVFALSGNAVFVNRLAAKLSANEAAHVSVALVLSVYAGALVTGEYRVARAMASELHRRAHEISGAVSAQDWDVACALAELWKGCSGVDLPVLSPEYANGRSGKTAQLLLQHGRAWERMIAEDGEVIPLAISDDALSSGGDGVDVPRILAFCDVLLGRAFYGDAGACMAYDKKMQQLVSELASRHLAPIMERVRMTAATCRLLAGAPLVDERAFVDAGTAAVRSSDFATQLFCLLGEGWQELALGQPVSARFRAQQVLRLAKEEQVFIREWATLLERSAFIVNSSKIARIEEAGAIDLSEEGVTAVHAWSVALLLASAGQSSELSAWCSLHKEKLLSERFRVRAQQALRAVGDYAEALRRLLPVGFANESVSVPGANGLLIHRNVIDFGGETGQLTVKLFGGFRVERNGHTLTDALWRRKKACVLAARLSLSLGAFVSRRVLIEELWPDCEYARGRENLYTALSSLRHAFGQQEVGPQYLLTQGDGVALNCEYIFADTLQFDLLARDVLLESSGTSGRKIVESCLRLEELYSGPLYVPEQVETEFFVRMRRQFLAKFVDCALKGVEVALEMDDVAAASWLVESALRQAPRREDVIRWAMRVFDRSGRRREVVDLYQGHLAFLEKEVHAMPEEETRLAYESIIGPMKRQAML